MAISFGPSPVVAKVVETLSETVNVNGRLADPVAFVAVIVYATLLVAAVGIPEISPVEVLKERPGVLDIDGEIEKLLIAPPLDVIV
jgi:hypothetical protein